MLSALSATIWWLALTIWVAAIIAPAAAAMVAFPTLPELEVAIPATRAFFAGDADAAGRFVAGFVTNPIFVAADSVRLVVMIVLWVIVLIAGGRPIGRSPLALPAVVLVGLGSILLAISLLSVASPLAETLDAWRTAVFDGDPQAAAEAKAAFDPWHERASALMKAELVCVLGAIGLGGAAGTVRPRPVATRETTS